MDVEDTLASFQGEEEWEALADKPAPKSHLLLYTLEQKEKIMEEAYAQPHHIQLTAWK